MLKVTVNSEAHSIPETFETESRYNVVQPAYTDEPLATAFQGDAANQKTFWFNETTVIKVNDISKTFAVNDISNATTMINDRAEKVSIDWLHIHDSISSNGGTYQFAGPCGFQYWCYTGDISGVTFSQSAINWPSGFPSAVSVADLALYTKAHNNTLSNDLNATIKSIGVGTNNEGQLYPDLNGHVVFPRVDAAIIHRNPTDYGKFATLEELPPPPHNSEYIAGVPLENPLEYSPENQGGTGNVYPTFTLSDGSDWIAQGSNRAFTQITFPSKNPGSGLRDSIPVWNYDEAAINSNIWNLPVAFNFSDASLTIVNTDTSAVLGIVFDDSGIISGSSWSQVLTLENGLPNLTVTYAAGILTFSNPVFFGNVTWGDISTKEQLVLTALYNNGMICGGTPSWVWTATGSNYVTRDQVNGSNSNGYLSSTQYKDLLENRVEPLNIGPRPRAGISTLYEYITTGEGANDGIFLFPAVSEDGATCHLYLKNLNAFDWDGLLHINWDNEVVFSNNTGSLTVTFNVTRKDIILREGNFEVYLWNSGEASMDSYEYAIQNAAFITPQGLTNIDLAVAQFLDAYFEYDRPAFTINALDKIYADIAGIVGDEHIIQNELNTTMQHAIDTSINNIQWPDGRANVNNRTAYIPLASASGKSINPLYLGTYPSAVIANTEIEAGSQDPNSFVFNSGTNKVSTIQESHIYESTLDLLTQEEEFNAIYLPFNTTWADYAIANLDQGAGEFRIRKPGTWAQFVVFSLANFVGSQAYIKVTVYNNSSASGTGVTNEFYPAITDNLAMPAIAPTQTQGTWTFTWDDGYIMTIDPITKQMSFNKPVMGYDNFGNMTSVLSSLTYGYASDEFSFLKFVDTIYDIGSPLYPKFVQSGESTTGLLEGETATDLVNNIRDPKMANPVPGAITSQSVYLEIYDDPITTDANWVIHQTDGSFLTRAGKETYYTDDQAQVTTLVQADGTVSNPKWHFPEGLIVESVEGNPNGDDATMAIVVDYTVATLNTVIGSTDLLETNNHIVVPAINELKYALNVRAVTESGVGEVVASTFANSNVEITRVAATRVGKRVNIDLWLLTTGNTPINSAILIFGDDWVPDSTTVLPTAGKVWDIPGSGQTPNEGNYTADIGIYFPVSYPAGKKLFLQLTWSLN